MPKSIVVSRLRYPREQVVNAGLITRNKCRPSTVFPALFLALVATNFHQKIGWECVSPPRWLENYVPKWNIGTPLASSVSVSIIFSFSQFQFQSVSVSICLCFNQFLFQDDGLRQPLQAPKKYMSQLCGPRLTTRRHAPASETTVLNDSVIYGWSQPRKAQRGTGAPDARAN